VETKELIPSKQVGNFRFMTLDNKSIESVNLPNTLYFETHNKFADAFAWLEVLDHMKTPNRIKQRSELQDTPPSNVGGRTKNSNSWYSPLIITVLRSLWTCAPLSFRAWVYEKMVSVSVKTFGYTGSDRIFHLPFNLYLRKAEIGWAAKHRAEFETLRLLKTHTQVPAPWGLDVIQYRDNSFLLMTGVNGEGLGRRLATLTDSQVDSIVLDLQQYTAEIRSIPRNISSEFQICNSLGSGILDWRISNSQREMLRFQSEEAFNRYLTHGLAIAAEDKAILSKAHSIQHKIVFAHADINMRNVLIDENGRISGIVDWECAGWYPEYWEYTKMHFGARFTPRWIADVIDQVFLGYREELRAEGILAASTPPW